LVPSFKHHYLKHLDSFIGGGFHHSVLELVTPDFACPTLLVRLCL
jgi:hypothetical protein